MRNVDFLALFELVSFYVYVQVYRQKITHIECFSVSHDLSILAFTDLVPIFYNLSAYTYYYHTGVIFDLTSSFYILIFYDLYV
jgi:hypothetical protein